MRGEKRWKIIVLCLCLISALLPATVLASTGDELPPSTGDISEGVLQPTDIIVFGKAIGVPVMTSQPKGKTYTIGDTAEAISVEASISGGGTLSYQWYSNTTDNNSGGAMLDAETNSSYTPDLSAEGVMYYYCVVTSTLNGETAEVASDTAKIEVEPAVEEYDVYIYTGQGYSNTRITSENAEDVLGDGGTVSYDASTCTLTLDNAKITGILTYGGENKTLTVNVASDSVISTNRNGISLQAMSTAGPVFYQDSLVVTGDGKLTINILNNTSTGISVYDGATFRDANIEINTNNSLAIALSEWSGVERNDLNIINSTLSITTGAKSANAIWTENGGISIDNSNVTITANSSSYPAMWSLYDIAIINGSDVKASVGDSNVLYTPGEIRIEKSIVTATGEVSSAPALYANSIKITDKSDVTAIAGNGNAVYAASEGILIDDAALEAKVIGEYGSYTVYTYGGDIIVRNGGDLTANSAADSAVLIEDGDMSVTGSTVTAIGANYEGIIVDGALNAKDSMISVSRTAGSSFPAIVTEQLNVEASEITADGGIGFYNWFTQDADNIAFSITPANGKFVELKVDDTSSDGSAAMHFPEGSGSPYGAAVNFDADAMKAMEDYKYIHIGEHNHAGGVATCTALAVCDDCGREYGSIDPDHHSFSAYAYNNDATCTANGTETAKCSLCGKVDTREKAGTMLGHNYKDGVCLVCGTADPNYKPAGSGEQTGGAQEDANSPQTGDESNPALWFALTLASGTAAIAAAAYGCWKRREQ